MWRSLAARLLWEQEVGGSNPLTPIDIISEIRFMVSLFYWRNVAQACFLVLFWRRIGAELAQAGLERVLELLEDEVRICLGLMGVRSFEELTLDFLHPSEPTHSSGAYHRGQRGELPTQASQEEILYLKQEIPELTTIGLLT